MRRTPVIAVTSGGQGKDTGKDAFSKGTPDERISPKEATKKQDERPVSREVSIKSEREEKTEPGQTDVKRPTTSRIFEKIKSEEAIRGLVKGIKGIFDKLPSPKEGDLPKAEDGEL